MSTTARTTQHIAASTGPLHGRVRVPGDKSISHRALIFASLAEGTSIVRGLSGGEDVQRTAAAFEALGVEIDGAEITGGRSRLHESVQPIDLGNSGTGMRLFTGVVAAFRGLTVLFGDASLSRRPMDRIVRPLREMGARIDGREDGRLAPLVVRGGELHGIEYQAPVASAQVKASVLLAGLGATGETVLREAIPTRRHTEEFLERCRARYFVTEDERGYAVHLEASELAPFELDVPGDPSQAAFFAVAASIVSGSELVIENVYVGPGRAGFVEALSQMGADITLSYTSPTTADIEVRAAALHATEIAGRLVPDLIDEIPVLCVAAAFAEGTTVVRDAAELRVKESDRIETIAAGLRALGAAVETRPDGLSITGGRTLHGGVVEAELDHRIAMSLAIAALGGNDAVEIAGFEAVESSWPSFLADLESLQ